MRYFSGSGMNMGLVSALPQLSFAQLCSEVLSHPVHLPLTREAFHRLSKKEKSEAKRTDYLTPAVFKDSPSRRDYEHALHCNLVAIDVDDPEDALRLLDPDTLAPIQNLSHILWHTASSTAESPRLRLLIDAEEIALDDYLDAVQEIGRRLGIKNLTSESKVSVQPMFYPSIFEGEEHSPIVVMKIDGEAFVATEEVPGIDPPPPSEDDDVIGDLSHYRAPMEQTTVEQVKEALDHLDPDMAMHAWIEVGAAIKHQFGEDGYELWDAWSAKGKKYVDAEETAYRWSTLKAQTANRAPVTIRTVFKWAREAGWDDAATSRKIFQNTIDWIRSSARSSEELFDNGAEKIAAASTTLGVMEKKTLVIALRDVLKEREMPVTVSDIQKEIRELQKKDAPKVEEVPLWAKYLCFVTSNNIFYHTKSGRKFKPEVLDLMHAGIPLGDGNMRPRDYLVKRVNLPQVESLRYDPAQTELFYREDGIPYVNTYRPTKIKPDPAGAKAAEEIYRTHLNNLIKEAQYQILLTDFLAYHFQFPGRKVNWAPLVQSTKGAGKTFLAYMMSILLGRGNVKKVSNANIMEGTHNEWAYGSQLATIEEVRIVGQNRHAVMDKLKFCITDDEIPLRAMYEAPRTVPNNQNYLLFTNYHDALAIQDDERRYFVLSSPLQHPEQIVALGGEAYFTRLYDHLRDNPGGFLHFFQNWSISSAFKPRGRAPVTQYLGELAVNAASPLTASVMQTISDEPHPLVRKDLLSLQALRETLDPTNAGVYSDQALAAVLRELGWTKAGRYRIAEVRQTLWTKGEMEDPFVKAMQRVEVL